MHQRSLPTGLANARDLAVERQVSEANAADAELAEIGPRPAADIAPVVLADLVLRRPFGLYNAC